MALMDLLLMVSIVLLTTVVHRNVAGGNAGLFRKSIERIGVFAAGFAFGVLFGLYLGVSLRGPDDRSMEVIFHVVSISLLFSMAGPAIGGRIWDFLGRITPAPTPQPPPSPAPNKPLK